MFWKRLRQERDALRKRLEQLDSALDISQKIIGTKKEEIETLHGRISELRRKAKEEEKLVAKLRQEKSKLESGQDKILALFLSFYEGIGTWISSAQKGVEVLRKEITAWIGEDPLKEPVGFQEHADRAALLLRHRLRKKGVDIPPSAPVKGSGAADYLKEAKERADEKL